MDIGTQCYRLYSHSNCQTRRSLTSTNRYNYVIHLENSIPHKNGCLRLEDAHLIDVQAFSVGMHVGYVQLYGKGSSFLTLKKMQ